MNKPKKHHYVQRAHLNRWSDVDGNIYICDLSNGNIHQGPAKSAAWEKYYYSIDNPEQPELKFDIEEFLGSDIEGPTGPVIRKICAGDDISIDEKGQLALYVAFAGEEYFFWIVTGLFIVASVPVIILFLLAGNL